MATTDETTITELELAEEILGDMVVAVDSSTDTKSVTLKQLRAWLGSSLPTGFIIPAVGKINDERFALLDGRQLAKIGTYQAFCAKVEEQVQAGNWMSCTADEYTADIEAYGQCGKFVIGQDYIRIPTITRYIGATVTLSEIGKTYAESLPNIRGKYYNVGHGDGSSVPDEGALSRESGGAGGYSNSGNSYNIVLNASQSSSSYQDGAKVNPENTKYPYYMVISTEGQTSPVTIDINQVFSDLGLKENVSNKVTNFDSPNNETYPTTEAVENKLSDINSRITDITDIKAPIYTGGYVISSGFVAPVDGWVRWGSGRGAAGNASCIITIPSGAQIGMSLDNTNVAINFFYPLCFCPKGSKVIWSGAATSGQFYFYNG